MRPADRLDPLERLDRDDRPSAAGPASRSTCPATRPTAAARPRRRRTATAAALFAVVPLLLPAAAGAKTVRSANVYAYGQGDVNCYVVRSGGAGLECMSQAVPGSQVDGYLALRRTGKSRRGQRGDFPGYGATRRKLAVGDVWRPGHSAKGIVCTLESQGLRCRNRSRHGFVINPDSFRQF